MMWLKTIFMIPILLFVFLLKSFSIFAMDVPGGGKKLTLRENQLPKRVFRVDKRAPEEIFANGFHAYGNNNIYMDHLRGLSCNIGNRPNRVLNSAFISTTEENIGERDTHVALPLVSDETREGDVLYFYSIRPTQNFYSATLSMRNYQHEHPLISGTEAYLLNVFIAIHEDGVREWSAVDSIANNQIEYAIRFEYHHGEWQQIEGREMNQHYFDTTPSANRNPFTRLFSTDPQDDGSTGTGDGSQPGVDPGSGPSSRSKRETSTSDIIGFFIGKTNYSACFADSPKNITQRNITQMTTETGGPKTVLSLLNDVVPVV